MAEIVQKPHTSQIQVKRSNVTIVKVSENSFQSSIQKAYKQVDEIKAQYRCVTYIVRIIKN